MPAQDIKSVLETKPLSFVLKTGGGKWKCTLHHDRNTFEKKRSATESSAPVIPGISRSDTGSSTSSSSSAGSSSSH